MCVLAGTYTRDSPRECNYRPGKGQAAEWHLFGAPVSTTRQSWRHCLALTTFCMCLYALIAASDAAAVSPADSDSLSGIDSSSSNSVEDELAERLQQAVETVAEMQLTSEQLKVGSGHGIGARECWQAWWNDTMCVPENASKHGGTTHCVCARACARSHVRVCAQSFQSCRLCWRPLFRPASAHGGSLLPFCDVLQLKRQCATYWWKDSDKRRIASALLAAAHIAGHCHTQPTDRGHAGESQHKHCCYEGSGHMPDVGVVSWTWRVGVKGCHDTGETMHHNFSHTKHELAAAHSVAAACSYRLPAANQTGLRALPAGFGTIFGKDKDNGSEAAAAIKGTARQYSTELKDRAALELPLLPYSRWVACRMSPSVAVLPCSNASMYCASVVSCTAVVSGNLLVGYCHGHCLTISWCCSSKLYSSAMLCVLLQ